MKFDSCFADVAKLSQDAAKYSVTLVIALTLVLIASSAMAQDSGEGDNRYVFDELQVFGEIDKPEAFYILRASNLDYENIEPVESFLDELYQSAQESPF